MLQGRYREPHARADAAVLPNMRRRGETFGGGEPRQTLPRTPGRTGHHRMVAQTDTRTATQTGVTKFMDEQPTEQLEARLKQLFNQTQEVRQRGIQLFQEAIELFRHESVEVSEIIRVHGECLLVHAEYLTVYEEYLSVHAELNGRAGT